MREMPIPLPPPHPHAAKRPGANLDPESHLSSHPCSGGFSPGSLVFLLLKNQHFLNSKSLFKEPLNNRTFCTEGLSY